jgi:D-serine deaminase-like pyridoxal phosphate-dependent protein
MNTEYPGLGPNIDFIGQQDARAKLATPALILDLDIFERNLAVMADLTAAASIALRPHVKSHKSIEIARRQISAGAVGVSCATLREAEILGRAGIPGLLITSPVVGATKLARLFALHAVAPDLMLVADNPGNASALAMGAKRGNDPLTVLVDIDLGMARTGVATPDAAVALARQIRATESLEYGGIQAYSGLVQHIETYGERRQVYGDQMDQLRDIVRALSAADLAPERISGGGTGTIAIDIENKVLTEHQAGSYIFMDVEYNAVELQKGQDSPFTTSLFVDCTVISNNAKGAATIDGGFKAFATDGPLPGIAAGAPAGARYEFYGDEHGRIVLPNETDNLDIGDRVSITTPHCDPTVNLHNYYHCVRGDTLEDIWTIDARGVL